MAEAWYISLFKKNYAHQYDREVFTQGTIGECDFLEQEFQYNKKNESTRCGMRNWSTCH